SEARSEFYWWFYSPLLWLWNQEPGTDFTVIFLRGYVGLWGQDFELTCCLQGGDVWAAGMDATEAALLKFWSFTKLALGCSVAAPGAAWMARKRQESLADST